MVWQVTERIINVSSISAGRSIPWDDLNLEIGYSNHAAYSLSKLAVMIFTAELALRVGSRLPTVNTLDPGTVNTKMLYAGWGPCGIDVQVKAFPKPWSVYPICVLILWRLLLALTNDGVPG